MGTLLRHKMSVPQAVGKFTLPAKFIPTHDTSGLPGFPAVDKFAPGGTPVCFSLPGTVIKLSGHPPTPRAVPGGPYGWSIYLALRWNAKAKKWEDVYYFTHLGSRSNLASKLGAHIPAGAILGRVADYSAATHGVTPSHIHEGFHKGLWLP